MLLLFTIALSVATAMGSPGASRSPSGCFTCNPPGVRASRPPEVGPELADMYVKLLDSVKGIHWKRQSIRPEIQRRDDGPFCCTQGTQCLLLSGLNLPFCYDVFTTNFYFPGGSYGNIHSGNYNSSEGRKANLITGQADGAQNIYSNNPAPDTSTLAIPSLYTSSGVGSAIPVTALGAGQIRTLTFSKATTIAPTTLPATTLASGAISGTTIPAKTITGPTTMTVTEAGATVTSTKKNTAATDFRRDRLIARTVIVLVAVLAGFTIFL